MWVKDRTGSQGLVSVLHRNSATRRYCFGFIARHITGVQRFHWAFRQDARPSPPGPNPLRERSVTRCRRCFTLAVGTALFHASGTQLAAWAGIPRAVSPCVLADVRQPWLDEQQGALAHLEYSTNRCPCIAPIPPHAYMLPGKVCGDVVQSGGEKWKIEERMKR